MAAVMRTVLAFILAVVCFSVSGVSQGKGGSLGKDAASKSSGSDGVSQQPQDVPPLPDAAPLPFGRILAVLLLGPACSFLRLWKRFRRYWHLGVTTNLYALSYLAFGMILSLFFYFAGEHVGPIPYIHSFGPVLIDAVGVFAAYVAPIIGRETKKPISDLEEVGYLPFQSSRNAAYEFLEEGVQDCVRKQMHKKVNTVSQLYGWDTIKVACQRALDIERNFSSLSDKVYKAEAKFISGLPKGSTLATDLKEKYEALVHILRHCEYRHLRFHLQEASKGDLL
jgi:hypothetical protein